MALQQLLPKPALHNVFEEEDERLPSATKPKPSELLRRSKVKQGIHQRFSLKDGTYCALGALSFELGYREDDAFSSAAEDALHQILEGKVALASICRMNNDGATFANIADWLESKGL